MAPLKESAFVVEPWFGVPLVGCLALALAAGGRSARRGAALQVGVLDQLRTPASVFEAREVEHVE
eukprot:12768817-Heterocapsa_arctica.AAC.1